MKDRLSNLNEPVQVLSTADIIFGIPKRSAFAFNFVILHANWFIHLQRKEDIVDKRKFWLHIKNVLIVEKEIAVSRKNLVFFNKFGYCISIGCISQCVLRCAVRCLYIVFTCVCMYLKLPICLVWR